MSGRRLTRMDTDLARQLVAMGRDMGGPAGGALQRALRRIETAAAAGALASSTGIASAELATRGLMSIAGHSAQVGAAGAYAAKTVGTTLVANWFASGLIVGLAVGGGVVGAATVTQVLSNSRHAPPIASAQPNRSLRAAPATQAHTQRGSSPTVAGTSQSGGGELPSPSASLPSVSRRLSLPPLQRASEAPVVLSPELMRELSLLDSARAALERNDRQRALYWLSEHRREFPNGQLTPEAALLRGRANSQAEK